MSVQVFREVERKMTEVLGKTVRILSMQPLGGGCIHQTSKIETNAGSWFLKWNANSAPDIFEQEARGLQALKNAAADGLKIPEVLCSKMVDELPGFLVLEYLQPGHPAHYDEQLGHGLAAIHRSTQASFGFDSHTYCGDTLQNNSFCGDWITFFRKNRLEHLLQGIDDRRGLSVGEKKVYYQLLDRLPLLIPAGSTPALIHGDLWSGNVMATSAAPALIDPAVSYSEREMEFAIITLFGGFSQRFYAAYNEAYPLAPDWKERNLLYQLYHLLNHYLLFGGAYGAQALSVARSYL